MRRFRRIQVTGVSIFRLLYEFGGSDDSTPLRSTSAMLMLTNAVLRPTSRHHHGRVRAAEGLEGDKPRPGVARRRLPRGSGPRRR